MISFKELKETAKRTTSVFLESDAAVAVAGAVRLTSAIEPPVFGWKRVQKKLGKIVEYGRAEGILPPLDPSEKSSAFLSGLIEKARELNDQNDNDGKKDKDLNIPVTDISLIHEAIPFLPVPIAVFCLIANIILPGSGTLLSGWFGLCFGQPRINLKESRRFVTVVINMCVGIAQFMTITFFLVGWFWSIAWGGLMFMHSMQYREALVQRRQEQVALSAIEALTKDSVLHRRGVKTLVKDHKSNKKRFSFLSKLAK